MWNRLKCALHECPSELQCHGIEYNCRLWKLAISRALREPDVSVSPSVFYCGRQHIAVGEGEIPVILSDIHARPRETRILIIHYVITAIARTFNLFIMCLWNLDIMTLYCCLRYLMIYIYIVLDFIYFTLWDNQECAKQFVGQLKTKNLLFKLLSFLHRDKRTCMQIGFGKLTRPKFLFPDNESFVSMAQ